MLLSHLLSCTQSLSLGSRKRPRNSGNFLAAFDEEGKQVHNAMAAGGFAKWMGSASKGWPEFKHRLPEVALAGERKKNDFIVPDDKADDDFSFFRFFFTFYFYLFLKKIKIELNFGKKIMALCVLLHVLQGIVLRGTRVSCSDWTFCGCNKGFEVIAKVLPMS